MPSDANFASFQTELGKLVEIFSRNLAHYKTAVYDEASLRNEFLNPLFRALGWDVENKAACNPNRWGSQSGCIALFPCHTGWTTKIGPPTVV